MPQKMQVRIIAEGHPYKGTVGWVEIKATGEYARIIKSRIDDREAVEVVVSETQSIICGLDSIEQYP